MARSVDPLTAKISSDRFRGLSCFTISQGTSIASAEASSRSCSTSEHSKSPTKSRAVSQYSSGTSDTGSSPGTYPSQCIEIDCPPLILKDTALQLYYIHMQKALRTCHPAALRAETSILTRGLRAEPDDSPRVAKIIAKAGCRKIEYSRSCALIAHGIFCQVSPEEASLFGKSLVDAVMEVFESYYLGVTVCASRVTFILTNLWSGWALELPGNRWTNQRQR